MASGRVVREAEEGYTTTSRKGPSAAELGSALRRVADEARNTLMRLGLHRGCTFAHALLPTRFRRAYPMSMRAPPKVQWTPELLRSLPETDDGTRLECLEGQLLVTPMPRYEHQLFVQELYRPIDAFVRAHGLGIAFGIGGDISLDPASLVVPDLFVIPVDVARHVRKWIDVTALLLAVEVLSPSTASRDRGIKRRHYQRSGVPEYWIADLHRRAIERWRPGDERPEVATGELVWRPRPDVEPLRIDLPAIFEVLPR